MKKIPKLLIKKYNNRRLYNTHTSEYITIKELYNIIKNCEDFKVIDYDNKEDLTDVTILQILNELPDQQKSIFSTFFLKKLLFLSQNTNKVSIKSFLDEKINEFEEKKNLQKLSLKDIFIQITEIKKKLNYD